MLIQVTYFLICECVDLVLTLLQGFHLCYSPYCEILILVHGLKFGVRCEVDGKTTVLLSAMIH
jgi:hypothetical protein